MIRKLFTRRKKVNDELNRISDSLNFNSEPSEKKISFGNDPVFNGIPEIKDDDSRNIVETFFSFNKEHGYPNHILEKISLINDNHKNICDRLSKVEEKMDIERLERERMMELLSTFHKEISSSKTNFAENFDKKDLKIDKKFDEDKLSMLKTEVDPEFNFVTKDGREIKSLHDLIVFLKNTHSEVFSHHVSDGKNDFAQWIQDIHNDTELAEKISNISNRLDMIEAIMNHR